MAAEPSNGPVRPDRRRKRRGSKWRSKYRLLMINDRTFEERFSIRLTRINVLLLALGAFTLVASIVTLVILYTPLKKLVPGYSDHDLKRFARTSTMMADSLSRVLPLQEEYLDNIRRVLQGEVVVDSAAQLRPVRQVPGAGDLVASPADSALRERLQREVAYDLSDQGSGAGRRELPGIVFFPPLRGLVTEGFDPKNAHYGVDIVTKPDDAVKAALDGTVTLSSWTSDGGHVIVLQHANDLVTVYKHNSVLLKKTGDRVKGGEAIAIVGNSGEQTDGPHLHFELWSAGEVIDPQRHIVFE